MNAPERVGTALIGGGPAGTALLIAAAKQGRLGELAGDLAVIERGDKLGAGRLGAYAINSDSTAETFLTAVQGSAYPELGKLLDHPAARAIAEHAGGLGVPLTKVGELLDLTGQALESIAAREGASMFLNHEALQARRTAAGMWSITLRGLKNNVRRQVLARNLVLATGGHQPRWRLQGEHVAGVQLPRHCGDRLIQSDAVLEVGGTDGIRERLAGIDRPRVVIVGGSTSAITAAVALLKHAGDVLSAPGSIVVAHRRPLRPFYPSVEAALADGFTDFGKDDICPLSGFVYRLAGFRLEARELVLQMLGIGGRTPDPRIVLHHIDPADPAPTLALLDEAALVVAALGYRPRALPLYDSAGVAIHTPAARLEYSPLVDEHCRVVDANRRPVPGVYGIGLAAGFVPHGDLGGEASFSGQANGLWLWQNGVGARIVDQLLAADAKEDADRAVA